MASITRDIFRKACNYAYGIFQKGKTVLDTDINDARQIQFYQVKDLTTIMGLEGFLDTGYAISESASPANNFTVQLGYGYSGGMRLFQEVNADLVPATYSATQAHTNLCSVVSSVTETTLTDLRLNLVVDAEIGRELVVFGVGVTGKLSYTVASNTSNTFTFIGETLVTDGVTEFKSYTLQPSTPSGARTDAIILNVFLDEVTPEEDSTLYHSLGGDYVNDLRKKIRAVIQIEQDVNSTTYTVPADYTDLRHNDHHYELIGYIDRTGVANITTATLTDSRESLMKFGDFVLKAGDTMTGDLTMDSDSNIIMDTGNITGGSLANINFIPVGGTIPVGVTANAIEGFDLVEAKQIKISKSSALGESRRFKMVGLTELNLLDTRTNNLATLRVDIPTGNYHTANKIYVDKEISSHVHSDYLELRDLGRVTIDSIEGLSGLSGHDWLNAGVITWEHNLDDEFVNVFLQVKDGSDWVQVDGSEFTIIMVDGDNITISNRTGSTIADTDARICAIKAHNVLRVYVSDLIDSLQDIVSAHV